MKTAIVGSGAMGQLFGARLLWAGEDVVFVDTNPTTLHALNERGITLTTDQGRQHTPATAAPASELEGAFDLIIIFTKGFHTRAAVKSVAHLIGPDSVGLTLQNGLGNAEVLQEYFTQDRTLLGMTDFPADMPEPGTITSASKGKVLLGGLTEGAVAQTVATVLDRAGLNAFAASDIRIPVWEKVAFNAALNTISAVTGLTVGQIGDEPHARGLAAAVLDETMAVAAAQDISLSRERVETTLSEAFAHHTHHKTSMLMDREAHRRTEVESIGGAVVDLGTRSGVATPVLNTLCELVRALEPSPTE
ncbi:2-dehydropantoate 2-reductase [Citricoccus alkalitolerans]|uniref:2-dehydropantoate 2-reductase n=1 Tax=Citricoccus alkalitolerans TaxID=246603 RepID=A0ABV8XV29_9MICC